MQENPIQNNHTPHMLSSLIQEMFDKLKLIKAEKEKLAEAEKLELKTNWVISSAARAYEKARNAIDYREEIVLRRYAIERIINRRLRAKENFNKIASNLVKEMIEAGYIEKNNILPEKIGLISKSLERYLALSQIDRVHEQKEYIALASAEIENIVAPDEERKVIIEAIYKSCQNELTEIDDPNKNIQLFLALYKFFLKYDTPLLKHLLLRNLYPEIVHFEPENQNHNVITEEKLVGAFVKINQELQDPLSKQFSRLVKRYYPVFIFFCEVVAPNPTHYEQVFMTPGKLESEITYFAEESYAKTKDKLIRSVVRAVIFIFITKMILAFILEMPYDLYIEKTINYLPLAVNLIFPIALMLISASLMRVPSRDNTNKMITFITDLAYKGKDETCPKNIVTGKTHGSGAVFVTIYGMLVIATFVLLIWMLIALGFNLMSGFLFFLFLSIVSFFAFRIRESTNELVVIEEKEGVVATFLDFLFLPFLKIGHWLSVKFTNFNVFLFIFDFIIEAPFKTVLEAIENWFAFMKEKKDEMMS